MSSTLWKRAAAAVLVAVALAACATREPQGAVFATAEPVAAAKPNEFGFRHAIGVRELEGLSETVSRNLAVVLQADQFTESLRQSLARDQMLAPKGVSDYELTPVFIDLRTVPVSENVTAAQAIFEYHVVRSMDGTVVFSKRIEADFSSIADPAYSGGGVVNRTLRLVGLGKPELPPIVANRSSADEGRGPGPERAVAREIHAARNAIALNIRKVMRQLVVASPERVVAPPPPMKAIPDEDDDMAEELRGNESGEPDDTDTDGRPLPPLAPDAISGR
jgi:hypothetical protein